MEPYELPAKDLRPYVDYIEWTPTTSVVTGPCRALVRAIVTNQDDEGHAQTYVYVGMPWSNDSRTVPSYTKFTVVDTVS